MIGVRLCSCFHSIHTFSLIRYHIPDDWSYQEARRLFKEPVVYNDKEQLEINWTAPDVEVIDLQSKTAYCITFSFIKKMFRHFREIALSCHFYRA